MTHQEYIHKVPGSKMAVLMIHGIVGSPNHFRPFMDLFPKDWSVYNLLLDGHGSGVDAFAAASMEKWKAQVFARLEELLKNGNRVIILGHSMGCLLAIRCALRYPDGVSRLFLLSTPVRLRIPLSTVMSVIRIGLGRVRPQDLAAQAMQADGGVALEAGVWKYISWTPRFIELLREMAVTEKLLPRLAVPAEAFHGIHDELLSEKSCTVMERKGRIPCTKLSNSGHFHYGEADLALLRERLSRLIAEQSSQ